MPPQCFCVARCRTYLLVRPACVCPYGFIVFTALLLLLFEGVAGRTGTSIFTSLGRNGLIVVLVVAEVCQACLSVAAMVPHKVTTS